MSAESMYRSGGAVAVAFLGALGMLFNGILLYIFYSIGSYHKLQHSFRINQVILDWINALFFFVQAIGYFFDPLYLNDNFMACQMSGFINAFLTTSSMYMRFADPISSYIILVLNRKFFSNWGTPLLIAAIYVFSMFSAVFIFLKNEWYVVEPTCNWCWVNLTDSRSSWVRVTLAEIVVICFMPCIPALYSFWVVLVKLKAIAQKQEASGLSQDSTFKLQIRIARHGKFAYFVFIVVYIFPAIYLVIAIFSSAVLSPALNLAFVMCLSCSFTFGPLTYCYSDKRVLRQVFNWTGYTPPKRRASNALQPLGSRRLSDQRSTKTTKKPFMKFLRKLGLNLGHPGLESVNHSKSIKFSEMATVQLRTPDNPFGGTRI